MSNRQAMVFCFRGDANVPADRATTFGLSDFANAAGKNILSLERLYAQRCGEIVDVIIAVGYLREHRLHFHDHQPCTAWCGLF
jgi:hypothetical protein